MILSIENHEFEEFVMPRRNWPVQIFLKFALGPMESMGRSLSGACPAGILWIPAGRAGLFVTNGIFDSIENLSIGKILTASVRTDAGD